MNERRLREIVSQISDYDEYLPIVAFLEKLQDDDKRKFIEFVKSSEYWKENDIIGSIINFVKGYVKNNKVDVENTKDEESNLDNGYESFLDNNKFRYMSMWDITMYYAKQRDETDTRKR